MKNALLALACACLFGGCVHIRVSVVDKNKNYRERAYPTHVHYNPDARDTVREFIYTVNDKRRK